MNTNQPFNDDLLGKYLSRETDEAENALVENWLKENDKNRKQLIDYQFITSRIEEINKSKIEEVDVDTAWLKVQGRIKNKGKVIQLERKPNFNIYRIAAGVGIFLIAGLLIYLITRQPVETITLQSNSSTLEQILPDGSKITLNKNSSLSYPTEFEGKTRQVKLVGEAFFEIKRDESKPFIIDAQGTEIKVLGTTFNIKAYTEQVKVSVETGKVSFSKNQQKEILVKGEEAVWIADRDSIAKKIIADKNLFAYKTHLYVFEDSSLEEVLKVLSEGYEVPIILKNSSLKYCRLTTRFEKESLPNTLNIIAETLNLKLSQEGETYYFDGECR